VAGFFSVGRFRLLPVFILSAQIFLSPNIAGAENLSGEPRIGGRIHLDAAIYDEDATPLNNGVELRRLWLKVTGVAPGEWLYKAQFDIAGNKVSVKDVYMKKDFGIKAGMIGQFKEPFSLEEQTGSNYITFMERGLPNLFSPGRNIGVMETFSVGSTSFSAGIFGEGVDSVDSAGYGDEGLGITARFVHAPLAESGRVVHLGICATRRTPDASSSGSIAFQTRPESHVTSINLAGTGDIPDVEYHTVYGIELAGVYGSISVQGEYFVAGVVRDGGMPDLGFSSSYFYLSWAITGESRPYTPGKGSFGRLVPAGEGAVEIAVRRSLVDLSDKDISGGNEENSTLGINYYLSGHARLMANYILVKTDKGGVVEEASVIQGRFQVDF
jgi:phosphate-selective porin OprO/OprP